eukprot:6147800-Prymnesium_polylepis.1
MPRPMALMLLALTGAHACSDHGEYARTPPTWRHRAIPMPESLASRCAQALRRLGQRGPEELLKDVDENEDGKISLLEVATPGARSCCHRPLRI